MTATTRIDRFLRKRLSLKQAEIQQLIAQNKLYIDHAIAQSPQHKVNKFSHIRVGDIVVQNKQTVYLMLHKPPGYISATRDRKHKVVLDLIDHPQKQELHIVGRLDLNTTGLLLLSNDGAWSRRISLPTSKLAKRYWVQLQNPIDNKYIDAFKNGMYFAYEGIQTQPAELTILSDYTAEVCLYEGKYHQIKRMFGRFNNPVTALHRLSVGTLALDSALAEGQSRSLTATEINGIFGELGSLPVTTEK